MKRLKESHPLLLEIPFNSRKKYHVTIHSKSAATEPSIDDGKRYHDSIAGLTDEMVLVIVKGAPEIIISFCDYLQTDETRALIDEDLRTSLLEVNHAMASQGQRVLAVAYKTLNKQQFLTDSENADGGMVLEGRSVHSHASLEEIEDSRYEKELVSGLTLVSLLGLYDPPRDGVAEAVKQARNAGIRVFMVTGDHPSTAISIAKMVGILSHDSLNELDKKSKPQISKTSKSAVQLEIQLGPNEIKTIADEEEGGRVGGEDIAKQCDGDDKKSSSIVVTGRELVKLEDKDWKYIFSHQEIVFARTTPQHKLVIVRELQKNNEIVVASRRSR